MARCTIVEKPKKVLYFKDVVPGYFYSINGTVFMKIYTVRCFNALSRDEHFNNTIVLDGGEFGNADAGTLLYHEDDQEIDAIYADFSVTRD